ncbi:MAG: DUF6089 family protein [Cytophagales bacterium]|nr:DUF6089 family protein [Cytophagales bacterium]MDW8384578.1 DUF6089 family protein [Flammeovirgaceae bacterium]
MRLFLFFFFKGLLEIFSISFVVAQKHEMGLGIGPTNYKGDLAPSVNWKNTSVAGTFFYRMNISRSISWKSNLSFGNIRAADYFGRAIQKERNFEFSSFFAQVSSQIEYNFFDMRFPKSKYQYSPYLFAGLGMANYVFSSNYSSAVEPSSQVLLPFGVGIKKAFNRDLNIGAEWITFKTFSDNLDGLSNQENSSFPSGYRGFFANADMYYIIKFSISYVIYNIICPHHYKNYMIPPSEILKP